MVSDEKLREWGELPGWTTPEKMRLMADLILREHPAVVVEIGVFGGRSALPQIAALAANGSGRFYAIDPYAPQVYDEGEKTPEEEWMRTYDYSAVRQRFLAAVDREGLVGIVEPIRERAVDVAGDFADGSIGVLHLDGCHYRDVALKDMQTYWPKVAVGGYIWVDDSNWNSLAPTLDFLAAAGAELVSDHGHYRLYRKPA